MILPSRKGPRVVVTRGKESIQLPERLDTDNMLFFGATGPSVYPIQRVVLHQWSLMIYQVLLRDHCLQVQVMPLLLLNSLDGLIQYVVFWELLHVHTVCAHCVHAFALQDCHLSQLLLSTTAVSVLQHHFSWMLLAAVLPALVTMIYYVTCAVPMSPVHVKQYIPQPLLVSCDLQCVLIKTTAHHQEAYCKLVRPWTNLTDVSTNAAVMNL